MTPLVKVWAHPLLYCVECAYQLSTRWADGGAPAFLACCPNAVCRLVRQEYRGQVAELWLTRVVEDP